MDIIRKVDLNINEQKKYDIIKKLVDTQSNKGRAAIALGITRMQVDRLVIAYKEKGKAVFVHGSRRHKPAVTPQRNQGCCCEPLPHEILWGKFHTFCRAAEEKWRHLPVRIHSIKLSEGGKHPFSACYESEE